MMSVLATIFDPLFLFMAIIAVSLGRSKHYIIPVTGVFIGLFAETLSMKVTGAEWGVTFATYLATGIIQAILAYFLVGWWRNRKNRSGSSVQLTD